MIWSHIEQQIRQQADPGFRLQHKEHLPGGCIDETWKISGNSSEWFVKTSTAGGALTYFQREAEGLRALAEAGLNTPEVIGYGEHDGTAWLRLPYVDMGGGQACQAALGQQQPSLLHGDLWSGNAACGRDGQPVVFDPACYYGDRETDLAMTELFGGFSSDFYQAYQQVWPLDAGYRQRKPLYNFYHILNHANLFGGGYGMQAAKLLENLLRQL